MGRAVEELAVVMPVYNEKDAVAAVLESWSRTLLELEINYRIHVYNDGSKDTTLEVLHDMSKKDGSITVHDKLNSGHGPTILLGYRENMASDWIFQVDSDNEMPPNSFAQLWGKRASYDFLLGKRAGRDSALPRKIISFISRLIVRCFYGRGIWDVNSPYRLMRVSRFKDKYERIPADTFAPNVIISGMACLDKLRICELPVAHQSRQTGEVSIKKWKLFKAALRSMLQTVLFRVKYAR